MLITLLSSPKPILELASETFDPFIPSSKFGIKFAPKFCPFFGLFLLGVCILNDYDFKVFIFLLKCFPFLIREHFLEVVATIFFKQSPGVLIIIAAEKKAGSLKQTDSNFWFFRRTSKWWSLISNQMQHVHCKSFNKHVRKFKGENLEKKQGGKSYKIAGRSHGVVKHAHTPLFSAAILNSHSQKYYFLCRKKFMNTWEYASCIKQKIEENKSKILFARLMWQAQLQKFWNNKIWPRHDMSRF